MSNLPTETNQHGCLTCPFCKGFEAVQVQQVQVTPRAKPDFAVVYPHCDARGPWAYNKDMAVRLSWMKRICPTGSVATLDSNGRWVR